MIRNKVNKILADYYDIRDKHDEVLGKLDKETQRIITVINTVFGMGKDAWWAYAYYRDAEDDPPLPQPLEYNRTCFPIYIEGRCETDEQSYNSGFPVKFFDMTNKEIEDYIQAEIKRCSEKEEQELLKKNRILKEKEAKKKKLKSSAINKLTKEEQKALGL